jgi:hypothetical protein
VTGLVAMPGSAGRCRKDATGTNGSGHCPSAGGVGTGPAGPVPTGSYFVNPSSLFAAMAYLLV